MKRALVVLALSFVGCAVEVPVHEPAPIAVDAVPSGLVLITESGLQPAQLRLGHERAVVFLNATSQELVRVKVLGSSPPHDQGLGGELLEPGAALTVAISAGSELRYEARRSLGRRLEGRVRRGPQ
tara:strand:- start:292 stop:669 length:378 start_codon:yes stop_codon:yes gene_type:complete